MPLNLALERLSQEDACEFRASLKHDFILKRMRETYRGWKMKRRRGGKEERRGVKGNIINSKVSIWKFEASNIIRKDNKKRVNLREGA